MYILMKVLRICFVCLLLAAETLNRRAEECRRSLFPEQIRYLFSKFPGGKKG